MSYHPAHNAPLPVSSDVQAVAPPAAWAVAAAYSVVWLLALSALWRLPIAVGFDMGMIDPEAPPWTWWAFPYTVGLILIVEGLGFLTVGLVKQWGDIAPSWIPMIGGRVMRPRVVLTAATTGGLALCALWISDVVNWNDPGRVTFRSTSWELLAFGALLTHVAWGPMLLLVTFDYWRRHRHASAPANGCAPANRRHEVP